MITRMKKEELVKVLEENMAAHNEIFEEALEGYHKEAVGILEEHIAAIKSGKVRRVVFHLPEPEDHTKDYERVIAMIVANEDDVISLEEYEFQQYVLDDWSWKRQFLTSNSAYSATAAKLSGQ